MDTDHSKRRRGLGAVTANACTECRKKRAKCDGGIPCARCTQQKNVECVYEIPVRQSKENMRTEIETLRAAQKQSDRVLAALLSEEHSEGILNQLRSGQTREAIIEELEVGKEKEISSGSISSQSGSSRDRVTRFAAQRDRYLIEQALPVGRSLGMSPYLPMTLGETVGDLMSPAEQRNNSMSSWGGSGDNPGSVRVMESSPEDFMSWSPSIAPQLQNAQKLPLIGTWHQQSTDDSSPDSMTLLMRELGGKTILGLERADSSNYIQVASWTSVTSDEGLIDHLLALYFCWEYPTFASLSKEHFLEDFRMGRPKHCSSLLVNALLAVGSRMSNQHAARTDPNDSNTAGDAFFAEAMRLLALEEDLHRLTTVQALGLMSIREASCGRTSQGLYFSGQSIRLAVEMGLHTESKSGGGDEASLEHAVRSATFWGAFSLDQCWSASIGRIPSFSQQTSFIAKPAIVDHIEASPWIPYTDDGAPLERNCTQPSNVRSVYMTFCELSEIVHSCLYQFYCPIQVLNGKTLLDTYTRLLSWYEAIPDALRLGQNFTPAVLFVHMYYHYSILVLFRPFIKVEIIGSYVSPRDICSQAAYAINVLVKSYAELYTLRRTPSLVPMFVLAANIAHLVTHGNGRSGPEQLLQGIEDLKTMSSCHGMALRGTDILRALAHKWNIDVELDSDGHGPALKDLCQPQSNSLNLFCPTTESLDGVVGIGPAEPGVNPLFWIFPLQGRPLISLQPSLEASGFHLAS